MTQYDYDETGAIFNFFCLTLLLIILLPTSYSLLFKPKAKSAKDSGTVHCDCKPCLLKQSRLEKQAKPDRSPVYTAIFVILGWLLFALIVYRAATTQIEEKGLFDPYAILGIDPEAEESVVKRAFKKLSLKFHPDKVAPADKDEAEKKFVDISKAYKVLTDEEAKKTFDETGHPDGKQAFQMGVALPKWLVEKGNSSFVLLVYTLIFGIGLPVIVARWWSRAKHVAKNNIMNSTMALFYRDLKDSVGLKPLLDLICRAEEFYPLVTIGSPQQYDELADQVKSAMESRTSDKFNKKSKTFKDSADVISYRVATLLYAHMLRVTPKAEQLIAIQEEVVKKSVVLTTGVLQIAASRHWLTSASSAISLSQHLVQAIYFNQSPLLQLPFIDGDIVKQLQSKKRNVNSIAQFISLPEDEKKKLLRSLTDEQIDAVSSVAAHHPTVKVVKAEFSVLGEPAIIPSAIVTVSIKLRAIYSGVEPTGRSDELDNAEEQATKNQWWMDKNEKLSEACASYFPSSKKPTWWIMLANAKENRLICLGKTVGLDEDKTARMQFQAPPSPGTWIFQLLVKSDSFRGIDHNIDMKLVVEPPEAAPLEEEEDDISEPEEGTLTAQMQQAKQKINKRVKLDKSERDEFYDSTDTDDASDDTDGEDEEEDDDADQFGNTEGMIE